MKTLIAIAMAFILAGCATKGRADETPPPTPAEEQPEVLTSGPIHEGFAEPVNLENQSPVVAPVAPPAPIDEIAPTERPAGSQFTWIPGYWGWDQGRNSHIWVSGCWRATPPGMYWAPGYWNKVSGGWEWVAGFWAPVSNTEIEYLPAPPAIADLEAPGPAPFADRVWIPPCWYWRGGGYILRPGYWLAAQADWLWVPSHYSFTPRGYVFIGGHWDHSFGRRGVLFAPVYFPRRYYERAHYSFALSVAVNIGDLEFGLFTCPRYCHYYFGDYYDDLYIGIGIFPWYDCVSRHTWYDPIYVHSRWEHRESRPDWDNYERQEYDRRRRDRDLRPPRTYRELEARVARLPESERRDIRVAEPLSRMAERKATPFKFEQVKTSERQRIMKQTEDIRNFGVERSKWESESRGARTAQKVPVVTEGQRRVEERTPKTEETGRKMKVAPAGQERRTPEIQPGKESGIRESEKVTVPTPPIADRRWSLFRKGPSRPSEEQKTEARETRREKEPQKSDESRGEKDSQRGGGGGRRNK
jgi:hypothetical protein